MSNNARIFRREARERGGYTRGGVSHHGKKRKRGTGSCSNLIKKFLHGGAAHSATPLLASAYLYVSLVGAGLEKIKNNFSYINVLTSGGAELFTPRFPSNLYKEWRGPDFKADLTRCRIILFQKLFRPSSISLRVACLSYLRASVAAFHRPRLILPSSPR